jgi:hypothetical protein
MIHEVKNYDYLRAIFTPSAVASGAVVCPKVFSHE